MGKKKHRMIIDVDILDETKDGATTGVSVTYEGNPGVLGSIIGQLMRERVEFRDTIEIAMLEFLDEKLEKLEGDMTELLKEAKLKEKNDIVNWIRPSTSFEQSLPC